MKKACFIVLFFLCTYQESFSQWTIGPSLPTGRDHPGSATVGHKIYVIGGFDGATLYNVNEVFDSMTGAWSSKAPMITGRGRPAVAIGEGDSIIYAVGGTSAQNTAEAYNINTNSWATRASIVQGRLGAVAGMINGKLYVAGGTSMDTVNTLEEYDPVGNTWSFKTRMPTPRYMIGGEVIGNKLYVAGGTNSYTGGPALGTLEVYDPTTDSWTTKASMPIPLASFATAVIGGKLYAAGGFGGLGAGNAFEVYDPVADSWTVLPSRPCSRGDLAGGTIDNKFYAIAGVSAPGGTIYDTVEIFNIATLLIEDTRNTHCGQIYPNPSNEKTRIYFAPTITGPVSVRLSGITGQMVSEVISELHPGKQYVDIETAQLPAGVYYYWAESNGMTDRGRVVVQH